MGSNMPWSHGPLTVSSNGRFIEHADGTPFFWLGDTGWLLLSRLDRDEAAAYLDDRRAKGFNVIHGDACNFDLGRKFDVIIAGDLIEHLDNFSGFFESCKRHMHEQSRLLISTPNPWFWKNIVKACLYKEVPNNAEHTCWLCPRTLRQLVRRHRMDIGEIMFGSRYHSDRFMPLPRGIKHTSFHAEVYLVSPK